MNATKWEEDCPARPSIRLVVSLALLLLFLLLSSSPASLLSPRRQAAGSVPIPPGGARGLVRGGGKKTPSLQLRLTSAFQNAKL